MRKKKLILIGNGMAGVHCIERLLELDSESFDITIFGREPHGNYNRIMLSSILQGSATLDEIVLHDREWYERNDITLFTGESVTFVDHEKQTIQTDKQRTMAYDYLIFATGSSPFILPIPGSDKTGVVAFRTIEDCKFMMDQSKSMRTATVIGGGLLGLEAAKGLMNMGMQVHVVHRPDYLMNNQLDRTAAKMLQQELEDQGMNFLLDKETEEIKGKDRVESIRFKDGEEIETDLVVMAAGVRPNASVAKDSGIPTNRAIIVNDWMETKIPNIFAVGECAEHRGTTYGLVKPLYEQGKVLAHRLCDHTLKKYKGSIPSTQLKISGVDVFSAGQFEETNETTTLNMFDGVSSIYKKIVLKEDQVIGAVLFGDVRDSNRLLEMIQKKKAITDKEKEELLQYSANESSVKLMPVNETVCHCNNVTKGTIIEAVQTNDLSTVDEVKTCTKASSSCGGCKPNVAELLTYAQSDECEEQIEKQTLCSCTELTDEEVIQEIQRKGLYTTQDIRKSLPWKSTEGCSTCEAALRYYLTMIHRDHHVQQEEKPLSEKVGAVQQPDGLYTFIPQMYGGMTNPEELKRVAEIAKKYNVEQIAIGVDQRIHLIGVRRENLQDLSYDLGTPPYSTHFHSISAVQTNESYHFCSCDKHQTKEMAIALDYQLQGLLVPYHVKMSLSCCQEAMPSHEMTKDLSLIWMNDGWEIYIGGHREDQIEQGELLLIAKTDIEMKEMVTACVQYYRETANFMESMREWVDRISFVHIREVLLDLGSRQYLLERLQEDKQKQTILPGVMATSHS